MSSDHPIDGRSAKSRPVVERIILGIDPGTTVMGFGVLSVEGAPLRLLEAGAIRFEAGDDHTFAG